MPPQIVSVGYNRGDRGYGFNMKDHLLTQPQPDRFELQQIVDAIEQTVGTYLPGAQGTSIGPNLWVRGPGSNRAPVQWMRQISAENLTPVVDGLYGLLDPAQILYEEGTRNLVFLTFVARVTDRKNDVEVDHFGGFGKKKKNPLKDDAIKIYSDASKQAEADAKKAIEEEKAAEEAKGRTTATK